MLTSKKGRFQDAPEMDDALPTDHGPGRRSRFLKILAVA
jgi:hypothetical protein